jgi:hypothetical protein
MRPNGVIMSSKNGRNRSAGALNGFTFSADGTAGIRQFSMSLPFFRPDASMSALKIARICGSGSVPMIIRLFTIMVGVERIPCAYCSFVFSYSDPVAIERRMRA